MSNKKSISNSFSVSTIEDGEQGKRGRFYYYAGEFDSTNDDDTFVINDAQAPFFKHIESGQTRYHVFNPDGNPDHDLTMEEMWAISNNWNNRPWEAMTNDFKYLITEAIFSNFAHFGSAIISGDWMISQYGTIFDAQGEEHEIDSPTATYNSYTYENAYTLFDANYPNDSKPNALNFAPYYAIDLKRGTSYLNKINAMGTFRTGSRTNGVLIGSNGLIVSGKSSNYQTATNVDLFQLFASTATSGGDQDTDMQLLIGDRSSTWVEIHSNKEVGNRFTSCVWLHDMKNNPLRGIIITPWAVFKVDQYGQPIAGMSKTWDELLS